MSGKKKALMYLSPLAVATVVYLLFNNLFDGTDPFTLQNGLIGGVVGSYAQIIFSRIIVGIIKESTDTDRIYLIIIFYSIVSACVIILSYMAILIIFELYYGAGPGYSASVTLYGGFIIGLVTILFAMDDLLTRTNSD